MQKMHEQTSSRKRKQQDTISVASKRKRTRSFCCVPSLCLGTIPCSNGPCLLSDANSHDGCHDDIRQHSHSCPTVPSNKKARVFTPLLSSQLLGYILQFCGYEQILTVCQRVCKVWAQTCFLPIVWETKPLTICNTMPHEVAQRLLRQVGLGLVKISCSGDPSVLHHIAEHCKNLQHLTVRSKMLTPVEINAIANSCLQLRHLELQGSFFNRDPNMDFNQLQFSNSALRKLENLDIKYYTLDYICAILERIPATNLTGLHVCADNNVLRTISTRFVNLERITITGAITSTIYLTNDAFEEVCKACKNLKEIRADFDVERTSNILQITSKHCKQLQELVIPNVELIDASIDIGQMPNLTKFTMRGADVECVTAPILMFIQQAPLLTSLTLQHCSQIEDDFLIELSQVPSIGLLRELNLLGAPITDHGACHIIAACPKLEKLILGDDMGTECCDLTDECVTVLSKHCPEIKSLTLERCAFAGDIFPLLAQGCKQLTELDLDHCEHNFSVDPHDDFVLSMLCESQQNECTQLRNLRRLSIYSPTMQDAEFTRIISQYCSHVSNLYVCGPQLTGISVHKISECCTTLRDLTLDCCMGLTTFERPLEQIDSLRQLQIFNCKNLTLLSIVDIMLSCPYLCSFSFHGYIAGRNPLDLARLQSDQTYIAQLVESKFAKKPCTSLMGIRLYLHKLVHTARH